MPWVRDINDLYDFLSLVIVHAPDDFPHEDYLSEEEQLNLDGAFEELRRGVRLFEREFPGADRERGLNALLEEALSHYRAGDDIKGAHILHQFEKRIHRP